MFRNAMWFALGASALFSLASLAPAQAIIPPGPNSPLPKIDGLPPELQRQLEQLREAAAQRGGKQLPVASALRWGGLRLRKVTPEVQEKLGLPENEGLVVAAVDPNSVAEKAGLKTDDVLVKINKKAVPSESTAFSKLVKDQPANQGMEIIVVRNGKEETINAAAMPALVQDSLNTGRGGIPIRPGIGGLGGLGGIGGFQRMPFNQGFPFPQGFPLNPFQPAGIQNLRIEMTINGAKYMREQKGDQFSGEYSKDDLKISVTGKTENFQVRPSEVTVQQGKESKKYDNVRDVPAQYRRILQQLMPSPLDNLMLIPMLPDFPPGILPGFDGF